VKASASQTAAVNVESILSFRTSLGLHHFALYHFVVVARFLKSSISFAHQNSGFVVLFEDANVGIDPVALTKRTLERKRCQKFPGFFAITLNLHSLGGAGEDSCH
jgi:hypothetical protein